MPNITLQISNAIKGTLTNKSKLWKAPQQLLNMLKKGLLVTKLGLELGMAKTHLVTSTRPVLTQKCLVLPYLSWAKRIKLGFSPELEIIRSDFGISWIWYVLLKKEKTPKEKHYFFKELPHGYVQSQF